MDLDHPAAAPEGIAAAPQQDFRDEEQRPEFSPAREISDMLTTDQTPPPAAENSQQQLAAAAAVGLGSGPHVRVWNQVRSSCVCLQTTSTVDTNHMGNKSLRHQSASQLRNRGNGSNQGVLIEEEKNFGMKENDLRGFLVITQKQTRSFLINICDQQQHREQPEGIR